MYIICLYLFICFPRKLTSATSDFQTPNRPPQISPETGAVLIRGWCRRRHLARCCRMFVAGTAAKKKLSDSWRGTHNKRLMIMMIMMMTTTSISSVSMAFQSKLAIRNDFYEFWWCLITVDQFIEQTIFPMMDWRVLIKLTIKHSYKRELGGRWWNRRFLVRPWDGREVTYPFRGGFSIPLKH